MPTPPTQYTPMQQGTLRLAFASTKRASSLRDAKPPPPAAKRTRSAGAAADEDDDDEVQEAAPPAKRRRAAPTPAPTPKSTPTPITLDGRRVQATPVKSAAAPTQAPRRALDADDKRYVAALAALDAGTPVHAAKQTPAHRLLHIFDLTYAYGPCAGVLRLARWERARAMGLRPPPEVYDILTTAEGADRPELAQSVFYDVV